MQMHMHQMQFTDIAANTPFLSFFLRPPPSYLVFPDRIKRAFINVARN